MFVCMFIYLWLCWVFIAVHGLLVAVSSLVAEQVCSRGADFSNWHTGLAASMSPALAGRWNAAGMPGKSRLLNEWKILNIIQNEINQNYNCSEHTFLPIILVSPSLLGSIFSCLSRTLFQKFSLLSPYLFLSIYKRVISPIFKKSLKYLRKLCTLELAPMATLGGYSTKSYPGFSIWSRLD